MVRDAMRRGSLQLLVLACVCAALRPPESVLRVRGGSVKDETVMTSAKDVISFAAYGKSSGEKVSVFARAWMFLTSRLAVAGSIVYAGREVHYAAGKVDEGVQYLPINVQYLPIFATIFGVGVATYVGTTVAPTIVAVSRNTVSIVKLPIVTVRQRFGKRTAAKPAAAESTSTATATAAAASDSSSLVSPPASASLASTLDDSTSATASDSDSSENAAIFADHGIPGAAHSDSVDATAAPACDAEDDDEKE
mmetsp:Transcript_23985/g.73885  ORF Transcript_23985/g.73885 Transcript_23985/m.73885 type:complete len:251 (+) Transcript_23985:1-753(+)